MKEFLKDYFTFTRRERNGVIVLIAIVLALLLYLQFADFFYPRKHDASHIAFEQKVNEFMVKLQEHSRNTPEKHSPSLQKAVENPITEPFDPNVITGEQWQSLGLKPWQAKGLLKYREAAGGFMSVEDFMRMGVLTVEQKKKLKPYLLLPEKRVPPEKPPSGSPLTESDTRQSHRTQMGGVKSRQPSKVPLIVEINSADTAELKMLRGIGSFYAREIVVWRDRLGGFVRPEQLMELWCMNDSLYREISGHILIDFQHLCKTSVNRATIAELKNHPYIKWNVANAMVRYREQHGPYSNLSEIQKTGLVGDELFAKIAPYLMVD